jgi:rhamnogalacturonyl hydrolase YesR
MAHVIKYATIGFVGLLLSIAPAAAKPTAEALPDSATVRQTLERANAAEIAAMRAQDVPLMTGSVLKEVSSNWVAAAYYVGAAHLARVTNDPATLQFLTQVAEHFNYGLRGSRTEKSMLNADDLAIGDLYEELYARRRQPGTIMPLRQRLDFMLPHLTVMPPPAHLVWWWSDALFMAPPVLTRMSALTGDPAYIKAMDVQWWRTYARLYDPAEHLYARDERFIDRRSDNGKKIFWARGNGWVMGGLARVLEAMPADFPSRPRYLATFKDMAKRIASLQQANGLWRSSMLDTQAFPEAETSGSSFMVYALAWGINHGVLDRKTYLPHVLKGWAALNRQLLPNGLLGAVQKTGDQPVPTTPDETGPYGQGAFLLAGIEVMNLGKPVAKLPVGEPAQDSAAIIAATSPQSPKPTTVRGPAEETRRAAEMKAVQGLAYDPTTEGPGAPSTAAPASAAPQADAVVVLPKMKFALPLPPADQQHPAATVRFAPDRYDDILWENDRTAHRIYGPALEAYEPPSGSGVDVWGKRVRYPFMTRQLRTGDQHSFHGEGLDYYNVGQSRGAGGLGIWDDNKLWVSRDYKTYEILKNGPDEARFTVSYAPWPVGVARKVWETREFSLPLGTNFTRMTSTIDSDRTEPLIVGVGIARHATSDKASKFFFDKENGILSVWEATDPDKGTTGLALRVDPKMISGFVQDADNYLVLLKVTPGKPFVYYSGAAWDKGLDIHSREEWEAYVKAQKPSFEPKN